MKIEIDQNKLIVCALCMAFAIAGGFGGFNLKSRLIDDSLAKKQSLPPVQLNMVADSNSNTVEQDACLPQPAQSTFESVNKPLPSYTASGPQVKNLIKQIQSLSAQTNEGQYLENLAETEVEFLRQIDYSPELIVPLLDAYLRLPDEPSRQMLRSLLAASGNLQIQNHALEQLLYGDLQHHDDWLSLLSDSGVSGSEARDTLFNHISGLNQPGQLAVALKAFAAEPVSANERQDIINRISMYLTHSADTVRGAALQTLAHWADDGYAYLVEQAFLDSSALVREAAVMTTFTSRIATPSIKSSLLSLVGDEQESEQLRMLAHQALNAYSLNDAEQQQYYEFHRRYAPAVNPGNAKG